MYKISYKKRGEHRKYAKKYYIDIHYEKRRILRFPAFADFNKTLELAMNIKTGFQKEWDNLSIDELCYWDKIKNEIKKKLIAKNIMPEFILNESNVTRLPLSLFHGAYIYFLIQDSTIVYIGKATRALKRITDHIINRKKHFNKIYVKYYPDMSTIKFEGIEKELIKKYKPKYNIHFNK